MKKILSITISFFILCGIPFSVNAQTAEDIVAKHIKAHGGQAKWEAVKSMKISGQFTSFSTTEKFETYKVRPNFYYSDFYLGQFPVIEGTDGKVFWTIDPWQDILYPREINANEENVFLQKAEFCTPFFDYEKNGSKVEYIGEEDVDGIPTFKLKLTRSNGNEELWYLNQETYLEYKLESQWIDFMRPYNQSTFFDDFRSVEGLILPFYFEREFIHRHRVTEIESIELNVDFDTDKCKFPQNDAMKKLSFMEGDWNVEVAAMTRTGSWYPLGVFSSKIEFVKKNLLQENITYDRMYRFNKQINYTYNLDNKEYMVSVYSDLNSNINIFKGSFMDTVFSFDNVKTQFADTASQPGNILKYDVSEINDKGFTLYFYMSNDKGENWILRDRFVYTRKEN